MDTADTLKILAVDDTRSNLLLLKALLEDTGHTVVTAMDGLQAIEACEREEPDVILMDVMMPRMDGIESATHIRKTNPLVPILFLSANTDEQAIETALQIGTDYITKPIQPQQLLDKLKAHFRSVLAHRALLRQKQEVEQLHARLLDENDMAAHVLGRMLSRMLPPDEHIQYGITPAGIFSGDLVLTGKTPSGRLHVMLADAIGHGLPAAFTLMPLISLFTTMTQKGFSLDDILTASNQMLKEVLPVGNFIATTAVSIDYKARQARLWVGGNPAARLRRGNTLLSFPSRHLALGLSPTDNPAEFECEPITLERDDTLIFFSDGLSEAWQEGDLDAFLLATPAGELFTRLQTVAQNQPGHDDCSLVVLPMAAAAPGAVPARQPAETERPAHARRLVFDLDPGQMADPRIMHILLDMLHRLGIVSPEDGLFGMVLSELFSNALDHGILGLSSEIKYATEDGFELYALEREKRLADLKNDYISVRVDLSEFSGQPATRLRIIDSGPGFDQSSFCRADLHDTAKAGRGLALLMNTCLKVSFVGKGNDITAYVPRNTPIPPHLPVDDTAFVAQGI